jgi:hypothetical protein
MLNSLISYMAPITLPLDEIRQVIRQSDLVKLKKLDRLFPDWRNKMNNSESLSINNARFLFHGYRYSLALKDNRIKYMTRGIHGLLFTISWFLHLISGISN